MNRRRLERQIAGGLKSAIDAHGPITGKWVPSATKRVAAQVIADLREQGVLSRHGSDREIGTRHLDSGG